jgi:hypothetical protein
MGLSPRNDVLVMGTCCALTVAPTRSLVNL